MHISILIENLNLKVKNHGSNEIVRFLHSNHSTESIAHIVPIKIRHSVTRHNVIHLKALISRDFPLVRVVPRLSDYIKLITQLIFPFFPRHQIKQINSNLDCHPFLIKRQELMP